MLRTNVFSIYSVLPICVVRYHLLEIFDFARHSTTNRSSFFSKTASPIGPPMLRQRTTVSNIPDVEMLSACVPDSSLFLHRTRGLYLRNRLAAEETGNVFVAPQIHKSILTFGSQGKRAITTYRGSPHIPAKRCPVRCAGSGLDCCAV